MKLIDKIFIFIILGPVLPLLLFLIFWWSSIPFVKESQIFFFAIFGLVMGIFSDMLFIKKWIINFYKFKIEVLILIYSFYMLGIFGFFMGVPVFNILPGVIAAVYFARKSYYKKDNKFNFNKKLNGIHLFNFLTTIPIFFASAFLALTDQYTSSNIKGMFNLPFDVAIYDIYLLIVFGGILLLVLQYALSNFLAKYAYQLK